MVDSGPVGNVYDKYGSRNPIARRLMDGFLATVVRLFSQAAPRTVLEVGAGEGRLADHLLRHGPTPARFVATDISLESRAEDLHPLLEWQQASAYDLPFDDDSFDLVICCEVLEHLDEPARGMAEVARVAGSHVLISTPREPLWRILNVMRGRYWKALGNTPGHVQHFSSAGLEELVRPWCRRTTCSRPLPWTVILGECSRT